MSEEQNTETAAWALAASLGWGAGAGWGLAAPGSSGGSWWFSGCCRDPERAWRVLAGVAVPRPMGPGEIGEAVAAMAEMGTPVAAPEPREDYEAVAPAGVTPASLAAAFVLEAGEEARAAVLVTLDGAARCIVRGEKAHYALAAVLRALGGPTMKGAGCKTGCTVVWGDAGLALDEVTSAWFWADWTQRQDPKALRQGGVFVAEDGHKFWVASEAQCELDLSPA